MLDVSRQELMDFLGKGFCECLDEDFDSFDFKQPENDTAFAAFTVGAAIAKDCPRERFYAMGLREQLLAFTSVFILTLEKYPSALPEFIVNNLEMNEASITFVHEMTQIAANFAMLGFDWYLKNVPNERAN